MNMKKIIMVLISMALVFTMAGAVSANELSDTGEATGSGQTTVMISENVFGTGVIISFPDTVYLTGTEYEKLNATDTLVIKKAVFGSEHKGFSLSVSSGNNWELTGEGEESIGYFMEATCDASNNIEFDVSAGPLSSGNAFLHSEKEISASSPITVNLFFETMAMVGSDLLTSDVSDVLTFTIEYIAAEESTE